MTVRGDGRKRCLAPLAALVILAALILGPMLPGRAGHVAAADVGVTVSVAPTHVGDGQPVTITVKSSSGFTASAVRAQLCRPGVTYQPSLPNGSPNQDFQSGGANCPLSAISSSADHQVQDSTGVALRAATPAGETVLYRVGAGVSQWQPTSGPLSGQTFMLTCGPSDPCSLVVEVNVQGSGQPAIWEPFTQQITYVAEDPFGGCGRSADGVLSSGGSDRMSDLWVQWTVGECRQPTRQGAATRASFIGEGTGVQSFASGSLDLAYSAGGYDQQMGLAPPADPSAADGGRRAAVNVPVALNAAVLAVGGGFIDGTIKTPYHDIKLTQAEVASFLTDGQDALPSHLSDIEARNPEFGGGTIFDLNYGPFANAPSTADATSWYMTRLLTTDVPTAWTVPPGPPPNPDVGKPRRIDASLAMANPPFLPRQTALVTGRPPMRKALNSLTSGGSGGIWFLTDLETANALGLTPVQIESHPGSGVFVAPTPETLAAAVPSMVPDAPDRSGNPGGILISNPNPPPAAAGKPQPYPLAFVEYALAPAQPLLNADCTRRDSSQALLSSWLKYITGPSGQSALPAGMVPLTPDLVAAAAGALPKVGAAAVTGTCANATTPSTTATTTPRRPRATPTNSGGAGRSSGGGGASSAGSTTGAAVPTVSNTTPASAQTTTSAPIATVVALPAFAGRRGTGYGGTIVAILGIIALSSLAAFAPATDRRRRAGQRPSPE